MFRFWLPFQARELSGFYHLHEDEHGRQADLNDPFGTPFEGAIDTGFGSRATALSCARRTSFVSVPDPGSWKEARSSSRTSRVGSWHQRLEVDRAALGDLPDRLLPRHLACRR